MKQLKSLNLGYLFSMLIATMIGVLPFSCKDNDDAYEPAHYSISPELKDNTLTFAKEGGKQVIKIETNRHWKIETYESWLAVTPSEGKAGETEITIEALSNEFAKREGTIRLILGAINKTIKVVQDGVEGGGTVEFEGMTLADFLTKYNKDGYPTIAAGTMIEGVVISDYTGGNTNNKNVIIQQGDKGLTLRFADAKDAKFPKGTVLSVKAGGLKLSDYNKSLQLNVTKDIVNNTGKTAIIEPKVVTLADMYAGKYVDILAVIENVQFTEFGKPLYQVIKTETGELPLYFNKITDLKTNPSNGLKEFSVNISKYATFKDKIASDKSGRVIGIIAYNHSAKSGSKSYSLWPRQFEDIQFTKERMTSPSTGGTTGGGETPAGGTMTAKDFLAKYNTDKILDDVTPISEDKVIKATVISDATQGNFFPKFLVKVQEGESGFTVGMPKGVSPKTGDVLEIKIKGAKFGVYFDKKKNVKRDLQLQLDRNLTDAVTIKENKPIEPKVLTLDEVYSGKYKDILVKLENVQFAKFGQSFKEEKGLFSKLEDCKTKAPAGNADLSVYVSDYATFANEQIPAKNGSVVGVLSTSLSKDGKVRYWNLKVRTMADFNMTQARCGGGTTVEPTKKKALLEIPSVDHVTVKFKQNGQVVTEVDANTEVSVELTIEDGYECTLLLANGQDILAKKTFTTMEGQNKLEVKVAKKDAPVATEGDPMITAYVEGTSYYKYIQIYNPTEKAIDLSAYNLKLVPYSGKHKKGTVQVLTLEGSLEPHKTFVYANTKAGVPTKYDDGSATYTGDIKLKDDKVINFNGNDPIALFKGDVLIDAVGDFTTEFKDGKDRTYRRLNSVKGPNKTFTPAEWEMKLITKENQKTLIEEALTR